MNSLFFKDYKKEIIIEKNDVKFYHVKKILKLKENDTLKISILNKGQGLAKIIEITDKYIILNIESSLKENKIQSDLNVFIAHTRIPVVKRLLKDLTTLKVKHIGFFNSELSEKSYLDSKLWDKYEDYLIEGASQGSISFIPSVKLYNSIKDITKSIENYAVFDMNADLKVEKLNKKINNIFIGCERGWSKNEFNFFLKDKKAILLNLSNDIMRVENACLIASYLMR